MSAPVLGAALDRAVVQPMPEARRSGRPRGRPFAAVVLELEGVLTRPVVTRARPLGADEPANGAVEACQDTVAALRRWRRGGLPCAAIGRGPDGHRVLRAAGLRDAIDVVLDGRSAAELGLRDEAEVLCAAVARMGVLPRDAVALCSSPAGVAAARRAGMGLVVGIDRHGHGRMLADAGAHQVTHNAFALRFPRRLPAALASLASLAAWKGDRSIAVFLDYDGTLAPIVDDPARAELAPGMRATLEALAERWPVAILSGRDRADVEARVGLPDIFYAGSHGLDIAGRGLRRVHPEAELGPDVDWDKGRALRWMLDVMRKDPRGTFPIHVGDDATDEDAFAALAGMGAGICVGGPISASLADWTVRDPDEVAELLAWLERLPT